MKYILSAPGIDHLNPCQMANRDLNYLRNFLIKGRTNDALEELFSILQSSSNLHGRLRDDVIIIRTQLNELKRKQNLHLISSEEAQLEHAQLQNAILEVINNLEDPSKVPASIPKSTRKPLPFGLLISGMIVILLIALGVVFKDVLFQDTPPVITTTIGTDDEQGDGPIVTAVPDVYIQEWEFTPSPPTQGERIELSILISNQGEAEARNFELEWWPNANLGGPEKTWRLSLRPNEERRLSYTYNGYSSSYRELETKLVIDPSRQLGEENTGNNVARKDIRVSEKPVVPTVMDVSGTWYTPDRNLIYEITQNGDQYRWSIIGTHLSGDGQVSGNQLVGLLDGVRVIYKAHKVGPRQKALLLYTDHPQHSLVILFKECRYYQDFLNDYKRDRPNLYNIGAAALSTLPNPKCPRTTY